MNIKKEAVGAVGSWSRAARRASEDSDCVGPRRTLRLNSLREDEPRLLLFIIYYVSFIIYHLLDWVYKLVE